MSDNFWDTWERCKYCADYTIKDAKCKVNGSCEKLKEEVYPGREEPLYIGMYHYNKDIKERDDEIAKLKHVLNYMINKISDKGYCPPNFGINIYEECGCDGDDCQSVCHLCWQESVKKKFL